ncbi:hypothetical protein G7Y79_00068g095890 [Physcia stellaris]|nr:hypothetical protein G7Y79_00068g095890 [Physcia stellaris]
MSGLKRDSSALADPSSDGDLPILAPAITKKSKTSPTLPTHLSAAELAGLSTDELVGRVLELQETLKETQAQLKIEKDKAKSLQKSATQKTLTPTAGNAKPEEWSAEKIADRANKLADQAAKAIKKQMKWQPSCKRGTTKWSHAGVAPNPQVFFKMLNLPSDGKAWKQKKISLQDFESAVGDIEASIRYGSLRITGQHVNVKWSSDENSFTLSGTYGL